MQRELRRSGLKLVIAGLAGVLFFWLSDPVWGIARKAQSAENPVDAMNEAFIGTWLGIALSTAVLGVGVWISTRRAT